MGVFFRRLKAFLLLFLLCGGLFTTFFLLMWGFFHYLKALLLRFSPFVGPFSLFKAREKMGYILCTSQYKLPKDMYIPLTYSHVIYIKLCYAYYMVWFM